MCDRYFISDDKKKIRNEVADNLHGHSIGQSIHFVEIRFDKNIKNEEILNTPDDSDISYFVEVDL